MNQIGQILTAAGVVFLILGGLFMLSTRLSWFRFGRLPGDLAYESRDWGFYLPVTTLVVVSAMLTAVILALGLVGR